MSTQNNNAKGFTIIEVVLVLAIAGLIFLVVFLALPALQRSQRDTQRRGDLSRFMSQVTNYQSNSQGQLPGTTEGAWDTFVSNYLRNGGQSFADPQGGDYDVVGVGSAAPSSLPSMTAGQIRVYLNSRCDGTNVVSSSGSRNFAAVIYVEQGNYYCQSNNQ